MAARLFRDLGYQVTQTPYSGDFGRDAIMKMNGKKYLLECKRYLVSAASRPEIQKFHSAMVSDRAAGGYFICLGGFTEQAITLARSVNIETIDTTRLLVLMDRAKWSAGDDQYKTFCSDCGKETTQYARSENAGRCPNGHKQRQLGLEQLIHEPPAQFPAPPPICPQCHSRMRLWNKYSDKKMVWGCERFPNCFGRQPHYPWLYD
jgi:hypothetical protein